MGRWQGGQLAAIVPPGTWLRGTLTRAIAMGASPPALTLLLGSQTCVFALAVWSGKIPVAVLTLFRALLTI